MAQKKTDRQTDTTLRGSNWLLTINNPTEFDDACLRDAEGLGWTVIGQKERGEEGTEHYQIFLRTPQVRFSAVKKVFKRAHIELAKSKAAAMAYVQKSETRIGELPGPDNRKLITSVTMLWSHWRSYVEIIEDPVEYFKTVVYFPKHLKFKGPLDHFDHFVRCMIENGWEGIEALATNPQVRKSVKLYGESILLRAVEVSESVDVYRSPVAGDEVD